MLISPDTQLSLLVTATFTCWVSMSRTHLNTCCNATSLYYIIIIILKAPTFKMQETKTLSPMHRVRCPELGMGTWGRRVLFCTPYDSCTYVPPCKSDRRWHHNQQGPVLSVVRGYSNGLQCLAQTHVISKEYAAPMVDAKTERQSNGKYCRVQEAVPISLLLKPRSPQGSLFEVK